MNDVYSNLTKAQSSVLVQMRTEKIGLNGYLNRIKRAESSWCVCNQAYPTVYHIIGECPKFRQLRREFFGRTWIANPGYLLQDYVGIKNTVNFMLLTRLLPQYAAHYHLEQQLAEG